jgi:hypothetical protein
VRHVVGASNWRAIDLSHFDSEGIGLAPETGGKASAKTFTVSISS